MINVLSNGNADLSNGKSSSAEDKASKDGEGGGSPNRKAPPPPKPSLLVTKEMTTTAASEPSEPKADRPAWMEELRSKQAHRKSGLWGKERSKENLKENNSLPVAPSSQPHPPQNSSA